ncbi:MAG: hypothetical protein ACRESZ_21130 [Methylococcales bacterium]
MRKSLFLSFLLMSAGCQTSVQAEDRWNPSVLSDRTIEAIQQQTVIYHQCLGRQVAAFDHKDFDSRHASNRVLTQCESELDPIRNALLAEKVPIEIANRYLLGKRHQAVRGILNEMMFVESQQKSN